MTVVDKRATQRSVARAESVGSLLRSPEITAKLEALYEGFNTATRPLVLETRAEQIAGLNRLADAEIGRLVQRQIEAGLDVVTDGEQRRSIFLSSFYDSLDGLANPDSRVTTYDAEGNLEYDSYAEPLFVSRLRKAYGPAAEEATFLRAITAHPFKITLPAPSYFLSDFVVLDGGPYSTQAAFVEDAVPVMNAIVAEAVAAGARWIQFDFPLYPALVAERTSSFGSLLESARRQGETEATLLDKALAADAAVVNAIRGDVTVAMHLCRGNVEGGFWSGSLAPIAERMFNELPHKRFLFEWEDIAREGDYEPIKYVPKDRVMALGMISTKTPTLEDEDQIVRRIEDASRHLDVEQLALTTQCGFASMYGDHRVSAEDAQWRKLELVGRIADRVWGRS